MTILGPKLLQKFREIDLYEQAHLAGATASAILDAKLSQRVWEVQLEITRKRAAKKAELNHTKNLQPIL
jgi:hypothetical protein